MQNRVLSAHPTIQQQYVPLQSRIKQAAAAFGNKAANLQELITLCQQEELKELRVNVPEAHYLCHTTILQHLDNYAPGWRQIWQLFTTQQGEEIGELKTEAVTILSTLRSLIVETFTKYPLPENLLAPYLESLTKYTEPCLVVRSTGEEDTADVANPGGNESVAAVKPDAIAISQAIGTVIASYFSEKSLKQRLLSVANDITKEPFMPVLLQRMIGEQLGGASKLDHVIRSGVMYTSNYATYIQLAPGHGELIVSSKAPFDTFTVTRNDMVYVENYRKPIRFIPMEENSDGKIKRKLVAKANPKILQDAPTILPQVALRIAKIGRFIEKHYGMPMDVEFVYDPKEDMIYLVQARPIPRNNLTLIEPSSISPRYMPALKEKAKSGEIQITKSAVIASAGNAARIISDKSEVIFCRNIETALTRYLQQKNSSVKAVIVEQLAPSTSHEAALFNSKAIPVLQIDAVQQIENILVQPNLKLIVDPQRSQLIDWTNQMSEPVLLIEKGLFTLPEKPITLLPLKLSNSENNKLFSNLQLQKVDQEKVYTRLLNAFETLEAAEIGRENAESRNALNLIRTIFIKIEKLNLFKKQNSSYRTLLIYALIAGSEIENCLDRYQTTADSEEKEMREEFLLLIAKLKSLVTYPGNSEVFSQSILQLAAESKSHEETSKITGAETLDADQFLYFIEFIRLSKIALNQDLNREWKEFALFCCLDQKKTQALAHLIKFSVENGIESDLLHSSFMAVSKQYVGDNQAILQLLQHECHLVAKELNNLQLNEHKQLINQWRQQISQWSHPANFDRLWQTYEHDILRLINQLSVNDQMSLLTKKSVLQTVQDLAELMDQTIKAMKGSAEYRTEEQIKLEVLRFAQMLELYHILMQKWMAEIPEEQYKKWAEGIRQDYEHNTKKEMLLAIQNKFNDLKNKKIIDGKELLPSQNFSVASAIVGSGASFARQFVNIREITLENLFSLMHQNIIAATSFLAKNLKTRLILPDELLSIVNAFSKDRARGMSRDFSLQSITHQYPVFSLEYNYPLNNHSAKINLHYDQITKKATLSFYVFGHNQGNRMDHIVDISNWEGSLLEANIKKEANYNWRNQEFRLVWEFSSNQLSTEMTETLASALHDYGEMTFLDGTGSANSAQKNLFSRHIKKIDNAAFCKQLAEKSGKTIDETMEIIKNINEKYKISIEQLAFYTKLPTQLMMMSKLKSNNKVACLFVEASIIDADKIIYEINKLTRVEQMIELTSIINQLKKISENKTVDAVLQELKNAREAKLKYISQIELCKNEAIIHDTKKYQDILSVDKLIIESENLSVTFSAYEFYLITYIMSEEQKVIFFNVLEKRIPGWIKSAFNLQLILSCLPESECLKIIDDTKERFFDLIKQAHELRDILCKKNKKIKKIIISIMYNRLQDMIKTADDFVYVLTHLEIAECQIIFDDTKGRFYEIIKSTYNLKNILSLLSDKKMSGASIIFDKIWDHLPDLVKSCDDLIDILNCFDDKQGQIIFDVVKKQCLEIISKHIDSLYPLIKLIEVMKSKKIDKFDIVILNLSDNFLNQLGKYCRHEGYLVYFLQLEKIVSYLTMSECNQIISGLRKKSDIYQENKKALLNIFNNRLKTSISETMTDVEIRKMIFNAIDNNDIDAAENLIPHLDNINKVDDGFTLLQIATIKNNYEIVQLLLNNGAVETDKTIFNCSQSMTSLHYAVINNNLNLIKLLSKKCPDTINARGTSETPLGLAASRGDLISVQALLESKNIRIDAYFRMEETPLIVAVKNGHYDVVKILLEKGASIELFNNYIHRSALIFEWLFKENENSKLAELLLSHGAKYTIDNDNLIETTQQTKSELLSTLPDQSLDLLRERFYKEYDALFAEESASCFYMFFRARSNITNINREEWSLSQILEHALGSGHRSRRVCQQLGWINDRGEIINKKLKLLLNISVEKSLIKRL